MSKVTITGLTKKFRGKPPHVAVDDLHLTVNEGEFLVLLGPSGCGKTTTLRCLAGLEAPDAGRITIGDEVVHDSSSATNLTPDKRSIGMVFQSYALWPHMTVGKNIGYPLRARKLKGFDHGDRVRELARIVDCEALLDRLPSQLSGGQQQRVALARGLVARPDLVLFDEPLSNLDARLRDQVRAELHELHRSRPFTAVFVTHDQSEALALGTRMAIMNSGRIEQIGTPEEVFHDPATEYVAAFIGMSNRIEFRRDGDGWRVHGERVDGDHVRGAEPGGEFAARFRPDDLRLVASPADVPAGSIGLPATVIDVEFGGRFCDVVVGIGATGDHRLHAKVPVSRGGARPVEGDRVTAVPDLDAAGAFAIDYAVNAATQR